MDLKTLKHHKVKEKTNEEPSLQKKIKLGTCILLALVFITAYFLLRLNVFRIFGNYLGIISRLALGSFFAMLILIASQVMEDLIVRKAKSLRTVTTL